MNDYSIISISDRAIDNKDRTRSILHEMNEFTKFEPCNGKTSNAFMELKKLGIALSSYAPDDGRIDPFSPGEAGICVSIVRLMISAIENNVESLLVLEDDAIIDNAFLDVARQALAECPSDWDFLSLVPRQELNVETHDSLFGAKLIHRCLTQPSYFQAVILSLAGMRKYLSYLQLHGMEYNIDSVMYRMSHKGLLNGFILRNDAPRIVRHDPAIYPTEIDSNNLRNVDNLIL